MEGWGVGSVGDEGELLMSGGWIGECRLCLQKDWGREREFGGLETVDYLRLDTNKRPKSPPFSDQMTDMKLWSRQGRKWVLKLGGREEREGNLTEILPAWHHRRSLESAWCHLPQQYR